MAIITIYNNKGGVGKTTLSIALYHAFLKSELKCLLVDLDPQQSIINVKSQIDADWKTIATINADEINKYDLSIIDTKPDLTPQTKKAIQIANIILIPFTPSGLDAIATVQTVQAIRKIDDKAEIFAVLNMVVSGSNYNDDIRDILTKNNIPVLSCQIGQRIAYKKTILNTGNIYKEGNKKAVNEIDTLAMQLYGKLLK